MARSSSSFSSSSAAAAKPLELIMAAVTGAALAWALFQQQQQQAATRPPPPGARKARLDNDTTEVDGSGFAACVPPVVRRLLPRRRTDSIVAIDEPQGLTRETIGPMLDDLERHAAAADAAAASGGRPAPLTVGVAGGSGSGKTTFARALYEALGEEHVTFITHDSYYKDLSHLPLEERAKANFDHPNALDTALLVEHVRQLKRGQAVQLPEYDFATHARLARTTTALPRRVILVEGILIFSDRALVQELGIKVFIDTESDLRLIRRIHRDVKERGRRLESIVSQYIETVRPMHMEFVETSKKEADVIIPLGMNQVALDMFLSRLQSEINLGGEDAVGPLPSPPPKTVGRKHGSFVALGKQGSFSLGSSSHSGEAKGGAGAAVEK